MFTLIVLVTYVQGCKHSWNMKFAVLYIIYIYIYICSPALLIYTAFFKVFSVLQKKIKYVYIHRLL